MIAHLLRNFDVERGWWAGVPSVVLLGFKALLAAAPAGQVLHDALDERVDNAERALQAGARRAMTIVSATSHYVSRSNLDAARLDW